MAVVHVYNTISSRADSQLVNLNCSRSRTKLQNITALTVAVVTVHGTSPLNALMIVKYALTTPCALLSRLFSASVPEQEERKQNLLPASKEIVRD